MLHNKLIEEVLRHLELLEKIRRRGVNWDDVFELYAVLHALQIHSQSIIDYLLHTCAVVGVRGETPLRCIAGLASAGLLSGEEREALRRLVGFRNIIVHEYGEIDVEKVRQVLEERRYAYVTEIVIKLHKELGARGLIDP